MAKGTGEGSRKGAVKNRTQVKNPKTSDYGKRNETKGSSKRGEFMPKDPRQITGNIGLYYVCYRLSRLGWNVMPTARNARGIDVLIYSQDASRTRTIQVKTLSQGSPVPLSNKLDHLFADFVVVCRHVSRE